MGMVPICSCHPPGMPTSGLPCVIPRLPTNRSNLRHRSLCPSGREVYLAVSYNYAANESHLYSNSVNVVTGPASVALRTIPDVNNWLGRSQWNDAMFQGKFNEFRIWEGALSADQVAASQAAGPNSLPVASAIPWREPTGQHPDADAGLGLLPATLQRAPELSVPRRRGRPCQGLPTLVNGQYTLPISLTATNQFIRLKK